MNALQVQNLNKRFGASHVLRGFDFEVKEGEIFGFLGPNGAGKSTTIRCIMDYIRPTSGNISVLGLDSHTDSVALKAMIGYVPSEPNLYANWTVGEHVKFVARVRGTTQKTAERLMATLELDRKPKVRHLSTGNQQKLAIVLGLMADPKLLILDEPTRGLDPLLQGAFHTMLRDYQKGGGTVFLSSHNLSEVDEMCDRVAVIKEGVIVTSTSLEALKANSFHNFRVVFAKSVPDLSKLGAAELSVAGRTAVFQTKGDINPVLSVLSRHPIVEMEITRATLEQLFVGLYQ